MCFSYTFSFSQNDDKKHPAIACLDGESVGRCAFQLSNGGKSVVAGVEHKIPDLGKPSVWDFFRKLSLMHG